MSDEPAPFPASHIHSNMCLEPKHIWMPRYSSQGDTSGIAYQLCRWDHSILCHGSTDPSFFEIIIFLKRLRCGWIIFSFVSRCALHGTQFGWRVCRLESRLSPRRTGLVRQPGSMNDYNPFCIPSHLQHHFNPRPLYADFYSLIHLCAETILTDIHTHCEFAVLRRCFVSYHMRDI